MQDFKKEPEFIKGLFNEISINYDKLNDIMSFGLHRRIKKDVIKKAGGQEDKRASFNSRSGILARQHEILDLCTGTGDLVGILKEKHPKAKIIGVDFSPQMLDIARKKHPDINFIEADCTHLPLEDESFDLCTISFGLRNIEDMELALKEIYRVLKKGGIFINLDLGKPNKFFNFFLKPYMYLWVAFLGKIFHGNETPYKYLAASNESFPSPKELIEIYKKIGFADIKKKNYLFGQITSQISQKRK